jgi:hypothetical protein
MLDYLLTAFLICNFYSWSLFAIKVYFNFLKSCYMRLYIWIHLRMNWIMISVVTVSYAAGAAVCFLFHRKTTEGWGNTKIISHSRSQPLSMLNHFIIRRSLCEVAECRMGGIEIAIGWRWSNTFGSLIFNFDFKLLLFVLRNSILCFALAWKDWGIFSDVILILSLVSWLLNQITICRLKSFRLVLLLMFSIFFLVRIW